MLLMTHYFRTKKMLLMTHYFRTKTVLLTAIVVKVIIKTTIIVTIIIEKNCYNDSNDLSNLFKCSADLHICRAICLKANNEDSE